MTRIVTHPFKSPSTGFWIHDIDDPNWRTAFVVSEADGGRVLEVSQFKGEVPTVQWFRDNAAEYFPDAWRVRGWRNSPHGKPKFQFWLRRPTIREIYEGALRAFYGFVSPPPATWSPDMGITIHAQTVVINYPSPPPVSGADGLPPLETDMKDCLMTYVSTGLAEALTQALLHPATDPALQAKVDAATAAAAELSAHVTEVMADYKSRLDLNDANDAAMSEKIDGVYNDLQATAHGILGTPGNSSDNGVAGQVTADPSAPTSDAANDPTAAAAASVADPSLPDVTAAPTA